jgi:hypothetical protein
MEMLTQEEIDAMTGHQDKDTYIPPVTLGYSTPTQSQPLDQKQVAKRTRQETWPVLYRGDKVPKFYGVRFIYEYYDPKINDWKYESHTEFLYKADGTRYC